MIGMEFTTNFRTKEVKIWLYSIDDRVAKMNKTKLIVIMWIVNHIKIKTIIKI